MITHEHALKNGSILNNYVMVKILGAGGFGITYLAEDTNLGTEVVIKEYFPSDLAVRKEDSTIIPKSSSNANDFQKGMQRFKEEAQTLATFDHPSIVKILGYFEANDTAYFVMEYEEGIDLAQYLKQNGTLSQEEILSIMMPILEGLKEVHRHNYLHRDIKPGNILLRNNKSPVLIDFGASKLALGEASKSITSMLTEGYAPLEQYSTNVKQQGPFTDLYAVGAVIYKMITGEVPPSAQTRSYDLLQDGKDPYKALTTANLSGYDKSFLSAIDRVLALKAKDRPQTVQEFQTDIANTQIKKKPSYRWFIVTIVALIIFGGSFLLYQYNEHQKVLIQIEKDAEAKKIKEVLRKKEELKQVEELKLAKEEAEAERIKRQEEKRRREKKQEEKELAKKEQKLVNPKNISKMLETGKAYYYGKNGVEKNYTKAEKLFLEAIQEGESAEAYRYLGVMYLFGNGVDVDKSLSEELLFEAKKLGDVRAKDLYECYIQDAEKTKFKVMNLPDNETLTVRTGPVTSTPKIDALNTKMSGIVILDISTNKDGTKWANIKYCRNASPKYGWVASRYLVPAYAGYSTSKYYSVINVSQDDTLNMRSGPGSEFRKVTEIPYGADKIKLIQCKKSTKGGRWCKIHYGSFKGWVSALYLQEE